MTYIGNGKEFFMAVSQRLRNQSGVVDNVYCFITIMAKNAEGELSNTFEFK